MTPTKIPTNPYGDIQGVHIADLNNDGYEDILAGAGVNSQTSYIFYGTQSPAVFIKDSVKTDYLTYGAQSVYPIDLNGDGYLDLWIDGRNKVYVLYGPNLKYRNPDLIINFPNAGNTQHPVFADINYDSYLDVMMGADGSQYVTIGLGPDFNGKYQLPASEPWVVKSADLNKDGFLDLVVAAASYNYIYWGSNLNFSNSMKDTFYGPAEGGCAIADLNKDNNLDFIIGEINGGWNSGNSYVRYGPNYHTNYQILPGGSVVVADWDNNGYPDYLMYWFDPGAKLFWNRSGYFGLNDYTYFPSLADDAIVEDYGNLYDRSNKERYLSRVHIMPQRLLSNINLELNAGFQIGVYGNLPQGINLSIMTRSSNDKIKWTNWSYPSGPIPKGAIGGGNINGDGSYHQYKIIAELDYHHTTEFCIDSVKAFAQSPVMQVIDNYSKPQILTNEIKIKGKIAQINLITHGKCFIYDVSGRQTKSVNLNPGHYDIEIADGQGIYFVNLVTISSTEKKKAVILK